MTYRRKVFDRSPLERARLNVKSTQDKILLTQSLIMQYKRELLKAPESKNIKKSLLKQQDLHREYVNEATKYAEIVKKEEKNELERKNNVEKAQAIFKQEEEKRKQKKTEKEQQNPNKTMIGVIKKKTETKTKNHKSQTTNHGKRKRV
jgi:hypothetical protein